MGVLRTALYCRLSKRRYGAGGQRKYQNTESNAHAVRKGTRFFSSGGVCGRRFQRFEF